jgi:hypothetical protein
MVDKKNSAEDTPSLLQITWSMFAAFCGVQNQANHDRDDNYLEQVGFKPYIIIGVAMTTVFVMLIYAIVQVILHFAST